MERLTIKAPSGLIHLKDNKEMTMNMAIKKLADYEDLDDQGRLLKLPCDHVYYIVDKGTKYATVMSKSIQDLYVFEIKGIDKDGRYWSTQEQAEEALKRMEDIDAESI